MNEKELLTKKMILVEMNHADISTEEKPIIGTQALATCVGVLLYSEENKRAIVAHASRNLESIICQTLILIDQNHLDNTRLKYKIIPGYDDEHYEVRKNLEDFYRSNSLLFVPFEEEKIPDNYFQIVDKDGNITKNKESELSKQFAFDAQTGKFVTDKVLFGKSYFEVNENEKSK